MNGTDSTQSNSLFGDALAPFLANGTVSEALLDDKITRILTPYFALDQASLPSVDFDRYVAAKSTRSLIREIAEGSVTLLKNFNGSTRGLPLNKPKDLLRAPLVLFTLESSLNLSFPQSSDLPLLPVPTVSSPTRLQPSTSPPVASIRVL